MAFAHLNYASCAELVGWDQKGLGPFLRKICQCLFAMKSLKKVRTGEHRPILCSFSHSLGFLHFWSYQLLGVSRWGCDRFEGDLVSRYLAQGWCLACGPTGISKNMFGIHRYKVRISETTHSLRLWRKLSLCAGGVWYAHKFAFVWFDNPKDILSMRFVYLFSLVQYTLVQSIFTVHYTSACDLHW